MALKTCCALAHQMRKTQDRLAAGTVDPTVSSGAIRRWIDSMLVLPQTPQLDEIVKLRRSRSRSPAAGTLQNHVDCVGIGLSLVPGPLRTSPSSSRELINPSASRKPGSEFSIVAGSAHRQGEAPPAQTDFERLLDRERFDCGVATRDYRIATSRAMSFDRVSGIGISIIYSPSAPASRDFMRPR